MENYFQNSKFKILSIMLARDVLVTVLENNTVARDYRRVSFYIGNFAERRILRMACEIRITHYCDMSLCAHVNYITNTLFIKFAFILLSPSQNLVIFTLFSSYYLHYRLKCFKYMASIV
jgi:hypothetical protein